MSTLLTSYLQGISRLIEEVKAKGDDCNMLDILHLRLRENIESTKLIGDNNKNQADRHEILLSLNEYTRELHNISYQDYCQKSVASLKTVPQETTDIMESSSGTSAKPVAISDLPGGIQQATRLLDSIKEYITSLQENVQSAKDIFNENIHIDQEQCEKTLSSFYVFDYSSFPEYNQAVYKAKIRLLHLNEQVKKLIEHCEICNDIDRPSRSSRRKLQDLIGILDSLFFDVPNVQKLLSTIEIDTSA